MPARRRSTRNRKTYANFEGLTDFLRDVGVAAHNIPHATRVFEAVASATVSVMAREKAMAHSPLDALASKDIRVEKPGTVAYGGRAYDFGAEFGSYQYKQFETWRGNQDDAGYFFWPSIREFRDKDMLDQWAKEAWKYIKPAFPESGP